MKEIMIATANAHKVEEFKTMLEPLGYSVKSLLDLPNVIDIEETGTTFEENALIKAKAIYEMLHIPVISDDSGFAVNALQGEPGVYSARFLGKDTDYKTKNNYIIEKVKDASDRGCQFICDIAYIAAGGSSHVFEGIIEGTVAHEKIGEHGFGYDPIFYYDEFKTTLANISDQQKNAVSHRGKALRKLIAFLEGGN